MAKLISFEVYNLDEELARSSVLRAVDGFARVVATVSDSLVIEPHPARRGVLGHIEVLADNRAMLHAYATGLAGLIRCTFPDPIRGSQVVCRPAYEEDVQ